MPESLDHHGHVARAALDELALLCAQIEIVHMINKNLETGGILFLKAFADAWLNIREGRGEEVTFFGRTWNDTMDQLHKLACEKIAEHKDAQSAAASEPK